MTCAHCTREFDRKDGSIETGGRAFCMEPACKEAAFAVLKKVSGHFDGLRPTQVINGFDDQQYREARARKGTR